MSKLFIRKDTPSWRLYWEKLTYSCRIAWLRLRYRGKTIPDEKLRDILDYSWSVKPAILAMMDDLMTLGSAVNDHYSNWSFDQIWRAFLCRQLTNRRDRFMILDILHSNDRRQRLLMVLLERGDIQEHRAEYYSREVNQWLITGRHLQKD